MKKMTLLYRIIKSQVALFYPKMAGAYINIHKKDHPMSWEVVH